MACTWLTTMQQPFDLEANDCEVRGKDLWGMMVARNYVS
jgi:hypothetical protein